jgi:hypothetical protein
MASHPAGGKKKPPPGATTRGWASTTPGGETQRTPGPGAIELSAATMQTSLTGDAARRGNTPAPHFDRPPETRMMTPGMLSLVGDEPSDDHERSETVEDITPLPRTFAQLSRTSPRP